MAPSPAERAQAIASELGRCVEALRRDLDALTAARAANQPEAWLEAKARLDADRTMAARARVQARSHADPGAAVQLGELERELDDIDRTAAAVGEPPSGIARLSVEDALLGALPEGPVDRTQVMAQAEAAVHAIITNLSTADTIALQQRLRRGHASDELVRRFRRLASGRQVKLERWLQDDKRRVRVRDSEARARQATLRDASARGAAAAGPGAEPMFAGAAPMAARPGPAPVVQRAPAPQASPRSVAPSRGGLASPARVTAEPEIRNLLAQTIDEHDVPALQQRKAALLSVFGAIPTAERGALRQRLRDPRDELAQLFQRALSTKLREQLLAVLDGGVVPMPATADATRMQAFARTVNDARFQIPGPIMLDGAWRRSQAVEVRAVPGFGPPAGEPAPLVQWRLVDRIGDARRSGAVTWQPAAPAPPAITVHIDEPGRWTVKLEIVDRGKVIATADSVIFARAAAETGDDAQKLLAGTDVVKAAAAMTDHQLDTQLTALRGQLGKPALGAAAKNDPSYQRLTQAIEELQWQQHQRGIAPGAQPKRSFQPAQVANATVQQRAAILGALDGLVVQYGIAGARKRLHDMVVTPSGAGQGSRAEQAKADPRAPGIEQMLHRELDLREQEARGFLARFDEHARGVAFGLLAESEARLSHERKRYGLKEETAQHGTYGGHGMMPGADVAELADAIEHGKRIKAAHDRIEAAFQARGRTGSQAAVEQARKDFEATKRIAIAKHPMLQAFLDGTTQQASWRVPGAVPGVADLGSHRPEQLGAYLGWELNRKLADLKTTRQNIADGKLSVFGVPKVVALAKASMRVSPQTVHDRVINERVADAHDHGTWTDTMLAVFSVGLGLLLAIPTGGTSVAGASVVVAGELALLATDLYMLGKDADEQNIYHSATNTDTTLADSLLKEEPAAAPLILRVLTGAGLALGVAGLAKAARNLTDAVARAREGIEAVRRVRMAADAAARVMSDPRVVEAVERLRPVARRAGMTDEEIDALVRTLGRKGGDAGRYVISTADASATVTREMTPELSRRLGVGRIDITGVAGEVGLHPTLRNGRVVVDSVAVGPSATVRDLMAHRKTVDMLERYNGIAGKVREVWDRIVEKVTGISRANPHGTFTGAHEAFAEVRKYELMIRARMTELVRQLAYRGSHGAEAAARIEDEILLMEGELSHWRDVLEQVARTGDPGLARGLIEAKDIGKVTHDAIAEGYPALPERSFYRRWPGGGPEGQKYQVVGLGQVQPRKSGASWVLGESESKGRVPMTFAPDLGDDKVMLAVLGQSESLRAYMAALHDPRGIALSTSITDARMRQVVQRVRTPRGARPDDVAGGLRREVDEDNLRHALKMEFRGEFFARAAREATPEARFAKFREITQDLNSSDAGNMMEDFLALRDPRSAQHADVSKAKLAAQEPSIHLSKDRQIDRVRPDGTAVEVKSGRGPLSKEDLAQLDDYQDMVGHAVVNVSGNPTKIERVMYEFTSPEGVRANLDTILKAMLKRGISVKVFSRTGHERVLKNEADLVGIEEWLNR